MAGGGASPAPATIATNPNAGQVLAASTAAPSLASSHPSGKASLPSIGQSSVAPNFAADERRVAEVIADAIAQAAAEERKATRAEARAEAKAEAQAAAPLYSGTNHFWIPKLGMSYRVHAYPCSRSRPPDNYIYRWGCAGENNVYILGHAYGVMKPLHDLYVRGGLRVGMVAIYANANGKVTKYRVTDWRVVDPTESAWAIADQPVPSMTLQTCVGKDGHLRLNVRLVAVD